MPNPWRVAGGWAMGETISGWASASAANASAYLRLCRRYSNSRTSGSAQGLIYSLVGSSSGYDIGYATSTSFSSPRRATSEAAEAATWTR
ncbi:MAG: hypothetical protein R3F11_00945 [Verrucomicrobiales bacterium]